MGIDWMNYPSHFRRYSQKFPALVFIILLCSSLSTFVALALPPQELSVHRGTNVSRVSAFEQQHILYASLNELCKELSFRCIEDAVHQKMECVVGSKRLKFTSGNAFVVVIDHASNTIDLVYQLPVEVASKKGQYYVPVSMVIPLLKTVWPHEIAFRPELPALFIDTPEPPAVHSQPRSGQYPPVSPERTPSPRANTTPDTTRLTAANIDTAIAGVSRNRSFLAPREATLEKASTCDITHVTMDARRNGTLIRIHSKKELHGFRKEVSASVVRIDIPDATVDLAEIEQTPIGGDDVLSIAARQDGAKASLELELADMVTTQMLVKDVDSHDLLLTVYRDANVEQVFQDEEQDKKGKKQDRKRSKWNLDCIVIDAGHGGKDPGAIGVKGVKEKNVTLGIALKLGNMIEQSMRDVKVVYTRKDDRFIELDQRGKIANEAEGKLFISIHCNSTEEKPTTAHGTEVYLLRPGRTAEAIRVAEFENSVVKFEKDYQKRYNKLTDENFIIVTMAQSAYVKYSERFAELFHLKVKESKKIRSLGVKQAGFYVLVGASMPSVLVETGFISNIKEEAFLSSQAGQKHLANIIYDAIRIFAREYQSSLKE